MLEAELVKLICLQWQEYEEKNQEEASKQNKCERHIHSDR